MLQKTSNPPEKDITADDDIRMQSGILEKLLDSILLISTQDGSIMYANTSANTLFGYTKDESSRYTLFACIL